MQAKTFYAKVESCLRSLQPTRSWKSATTKIGGRFCWCGTTPKIVGQCNNLENRPKTAQWPTFDGYALWDAYPQIHQINLSLRRSFLKLRISKEGQKILLQWSIEARSEFLISSIGCSVQTLPWQDNVMRFRIKTQFWADTRWYALRRYLVHASHRLEIRSFSWDSLEYAQPMKGAANVLRAAHLFYPLPSSTSSHKSSPNA